MITQTLTTTFKVNALSQLENFTASSPYTYKLALYTALAGLDNTTTTYTPSNEVVGTGYTAGGNNLTIIPVAGSTTSNVAYISFQNVTWTGASFTCRGGLIYNATTGASVCVINFGSDKTASNTFTVVFPADDSSNAIIRFS